LGVRYDTQFDLKRTSRGPLFFFPAVGDGIGAGATLPRYGS
jgi:hypothetical protein